MKLLLDTCAFLWLASGSTELSRPAAEAFLDPENELYLSAASAWEIATKYSLGRLSLPQSPELYIPQVRQRGTIEPLMLDEESAIFTSKLPRLHNDPFDRILVAQAIVHGMVIVTPDPEIGKYAARILW